MDKSIGILVWEKRSQKLLEDMRRYIRSYREGVCSKCTEQERRGCRAYSDGPYCSHMIKAKTRKFGDRIEAEFMHKMLVSKEADG